MKARERTDDVTNVRMLDTKQLMQYTSLGKNSAMIFGKECGAARYIGRRLLFDKAIIDRALTELPQE